MSLIKKKLPQVYFRVDHGDLIGNGHLFRDKALADKMKQAGFNPVFITRPRKGFDKKKFLPYVPLTLTPSYLTDWLGVTEQQDFIECLELTKNSLKNIWIVDHYGINSIWEKMMTETGHFVVTIDDLFRDHHSHIVIDHNLTAKESRYNREDNTKYLMGPKFALLREDISTSSEYNPNNLKKSYLLFLGTVDEKLFNKYIKILRRISIDHLKIIAPPKNFIPNANEEIIQFCNNLPSLYLEQILVFGSCGVAQLERMALGIPTVTAVIVDNQVEVGLELDSLGISEHLGDLRYISEAVLESKLKEAISSHQKLVDKALKGIVLVSKDGAFKVTEMIKAEYFNWDTASLA